MPNLARLIALDPQMHGRPVATRPIRDDDYLPIESVELDQNRDGMMEPSFRYFVSATTLPSVGTFGREAQATYLFDKVRLAIEAGQTSEISLFSLGRELQNLLATIMDQAGGRWGVYCDATQMSIA